MINLRQTRCVPINEPKTHSKRNRDSVTFLDEATRRGVLIAAEHARFQALYGLVIKPKANFETGEDELWELKDHREWFALGIGRIVSRR